MDMGQISQRLLMIGGCLLSEGCLQMGEKRSKELRSKTSGTNVSKFEGKYREAQTPG